MISLRARYKCNHDVEGVREKGAEENIWVSEEESGRGVEETAQ